MPPIIRELAQPEAVRPWALPPRMTVSAETRRMLMEIVEEDDEDDAFEPAEVIDFAAFRARRTR